MLPTSDDDPPIQHPKNDTRGARFDLRIDELNRSFDTVYHVYNFTCYIFVPTIYSSFYILYSFHGYCR